MTIREFGPSEHLIDLKGKAYLPVVWRLYWLRHTVPDASLTTEAITLTADLAVFRATIRLPSGAVATGHGSETPRDFPDFIEKAETKSIGRALAALGYGTAFALADFDEGGQPSESPMERPTASARPAPTGQPPAAAATPIDLASPAQVKAIYAIARNGRQMSEEEVDAETRLAFGQPPTRLSKRQASEYIDQLKSPKGEVVGQTTPSPAPAAPSPQPKEATDPERQRLGRALMAWDGLIAEAMELQIDLPMYTAGTPIDQIVRSGRLWRELLRVARTSPAFREALLEWDSQATMARDLGLVVADLPEQVTVPVLAVETNRLVAAIKAENERRVTAPVGTGG